MRRGALALALAAACLWTISSAARAAEEAVGEAAAETEEEAQEVHDVEGADEAAGGEEGEAAEAPEEDAGDEEPGLLLSYAESVKTRALTGLNGLLTAPADPVMATRTPPKAFAKGGRAQRPLGFASGVLLLFYRAFTGSVDLAFAVAPGLPVLSPVPRFKLIPGFTHEDEE